MIRIQIISKTSNSQETYSTGIESNADLGPVLSWNPTTGSLQLSQDATQMLLASLGGRLTRRNGGLTVFFPIAESEY